MQNTLRGVRHIDGKLSFCCRSRNAHVFRSLSYIDRTVSRVQGSKGLSQMSKVSILVPTGGVGFQKWDYWENAFVADVAYRVT